MKPHVTKQTRRLIADDGGIEQAATLLAQGETVAIPTETVYGLAGDARNGDAVARIYAAKGRPSFNPLIVHLADRAMADEIGVFGPEAGLLADAFWPGALTLVLPLRPIARIASLVTAGLDTIALRLPANDTARALLRRFGGPLAAPSANASGRISPTSADHVLDPEGGLSGRIAAVLDAGPCPVGVESTIIGWVHGRATLLRPGGIPAEAIEAALGHELAGYTADQSAPNAPGQLTSHYAPKAHLRLNATETREGETHLTFGRPGPFALSSVGDLTEAAANLFDMLRRADSLGRPIAVDPIPDHGLGVAINDRLRRAAAPRS
ncbi:L-threonylcarbamoyladenylate synthase [Paracoccus fistulariae]|uniref:Threonylcarbamoyl-AMP synthase n=1 Tax=Paracoccus fistulariae TaxID=658446 RepID=A0ABY7SIF7_9RHOB|nr:L-threonylcarbamoyladenylate synthase [Paracoccus fistulariae]MDB6182182.1 L-threonylcarbamoyladenylate synthase [Paracoccus fistulariae]WCR06596.1 threonylcarbamoyl-AMP synthase [Paracoccus fistulariae]